MNNTQETLPALRYELRPSDRNALREVLESTGVFHAFEIPVALELLDDRLARGAQSEFSFILAEQEGCILGFVCYGPITVTDRRYDLYWIAVRKDCQGRGVGARLLQAAEAQVRALGGRHIYIETSARALYEPTRAFYLRQHYREVARIPAYYADDDDRVIYVKVLAETA